MSIFILKILCQFMVMHNSKLADPKACLGNAWLSLFCLVMSDGLLVPWCTMSFSPNMLPLLVSMPVAADFAILPTHVEMIVLTHA